jgi:catechol 2,3-dioxygenase-like lactoylglutathione lyase family enzyme
MASQKLGEVIIGVRSLAHALKTWVDALGFALIRQDDGHALAALLDVPLTAIRRSALLALNAAEHARVLLIEFADDGCPDIRAGAAPTDRCPKNLDVLCADVAGKMAALSASGERFRSDWVEYPVDHALTAREVQMYGHDSTNLGLLELIGVPAPFNALGVAGLTTVVCINADADREQAFFTEGLGFTQIRAHRLGGPEIERMIGLPPGAELDFRLFGDADDLLGRIEHVQYVGAAGANRYPTTRGAAFGTLGLTVRVEALAPVRGALRDRPSRDFSIEPSVLGAGKGIETSSPAGLRVWVYRIFATA